MLILPLSFFLSSRGSLGKRVRIALKISLEKLFDASVQKLVMRKDRSTHCNLNTKEKIKEILLITGQSCPALWGQS